MFNPKRVFNPGEKVIIPQSILVLITVGIFLALNVNRDVLGAYCSAGSSQCSEYITDVHLGTIHNTDTGCGSGGYTDYTSISTNLEKKKSYQITVTNGQPYDNDQCTMWIDWNQDEDFYDPGETIPLSGHPSNLQTEFTVPGTASFGPTRMRLRIMYTGTVSPCGWSSYGEVEDYTINVVDENTTRIIHESATMGAYGQLSGWGFDDQTFYGSRFYVEVPTEVTAIGGHLLDYIEGSIFGVIVSLSGYNALPQGGPFYSWEVMASTTFELSDVSMDFRVPLSVTLEPGYYALVFGAGRFGASSSAVGLLAYEGQNTISGASFFGWNGYYWANTSFGSDPPRFVVEGTAVQQGRRIFGKKWHDLNDSGQIDSGEPGLGGWTIFLDENGNGQIDPNDITTTTDSSGNYELTGMDPDASYYHVSEINQSGWINTYPGAGGQHYRIWVEDDNDIELNFGNYQIHNGDVNGYTFFDVNNNGVWDSGETPLSGWEIYIDDNENGQWDSGESKTTTDASGYYEFTDLTPGYYNIMDIPQSGWLQTYPGITSGRMWALDGGNDEASTIYEVNLMDMTIENFFTAPENSTIIGVGCLAAVPGTLFYCPWRVTGQDTTENLVFEIDCESGLVLYQGILDLPENEVAWTCTWHQGVLYVISVEIPAPDPWIIYLNRYDAITKELISRDLLDESISGDSMAGDPYKDVLLMNRAVPWVVHEVDPNTATVIKLIKQQMPVRTLMAYTQGVLYKSHFTFDGMTIINRYDGSLISTEPINEDTSFDALSGGIGVKGGHRVWIGKGDVTANFGNRPDSDAAFAGTKYEDINGNGQRDTNEPGMGGWTVYADLDGDMHDDMLEPSTVTDANGDWAIGGLTYGNYFIREVQRKDYTCTEPRLRWIDIVDVNRPRDIVFDNLRDRLYISTEAGTLERYDLRTNQLLSPITLGGSPHGIDITADCGSLYVADTQLTGGDGVVHKIDMDTLNVTDLTYAVDTTEDGSYDIAIGSQGIALVTASYSGSSLVPLHVLDTRTDTITVRPDIMGEATVEDECRVIRSHDRTTLWLVGNNSGGWVAVYDSPGDTFISEYQYHQYLHQSPIALNNDGSMAAVELDEHCRIVDTDFNMVMGLTDSESGALFDPAGGAFYQFQSRSKRLQTIDTVMWEVLNDIGAGYMAQSYETFVNGETGITNDSRVLAVTDPNFVVLYRREYYTPALPGRTIDAIYFGNTHRLCGDIDRDKDVDPMDLRYLCQDWLCYDIRSDVAPAVRDYVVDMADFARLANAWLSRDGDAHWDALCNLESGDDEDHIGGKDLSLLANEWLMDGLMYDSDIAGSDGHVNMQDFACLADNWAVAENTIDYTEDFETGDFNNLPWEHDGTVHWTIDSAECFEGSYCAKSGDVARYDESTLRITTTCGEGNIYFMLKNGSGGSLTFWMDGGLVYEWDPVNGEDLQWSLVRVFLPVSAGAHTFEWTYSPDGFGEDHAWIDAIRLPPVDE